VCVTKRFRQLGLIDASESYGRTRNAGMRRSKAAPFGGSEDLPRPTSNIDLGRISAIPGGNYGGCNFTGRYNIGHVSVRMGNN
jgi:hypothetical protein